MAGQRNRSRLFMIPLLASVVVASVSIGCSKQSPREILAIDRGQLTIGPFHLTDQLDHVTHRVSLKNVGDKPIRIVKWETSCSCTVVEESTSEIAPGGESTLTMKIRLPDLRRQQRDPSSALGVMCRPIVSVDGKASEALPGWVFHVELIPFVVSGNRIAVGRVIGGDQPKKSFPIKLHDDIVQQGIRSATHDVKVRSESTDDRNARITIESVSPKLGFGEGMLVVRGRSKSTGAELETSVPVSWNRVPELDWVIGERLIDSCTSDGLEPGSLDLFSHRSEPFTIESVETLHDGLLLWRIDGSRIDYLWQPAHPEYGMAIVSVRGRYRGQLIDLPPAFMLMKPLTGGAP